ncbi:hypothetical protein LC040_01320 [Bacillus tianshenii]|nr:hypothetical protein LC040_01320 [Bacillus tianshenii]
MEKLAVIHPLSYIGYGVCRYFVEKGVEVNAYFTSSELSEREEWMLMDFERNALFRRVEQERQAEQLQGKCLIYCLVDNPASHNDVQKWWSKCAKARSKFILLSSYEVFGDHQKVVDEDTLPEPTSQFGQQILSIEEGLQSTEALEWLIIRIPKLIGEWNDEQMLRESNDALYILDAAQGIKEIMDKSYSNEVVHLTNSQFENRRALSLKYTYSPNITIDQAIKKQKEHIRKQQKLF